jgi:2-polyprenyl-6-methoxyphenol hydroxylase-like FAD-dependent oxidoreductase
MKVIIIGAGIAGLATALMLEREGIRADLYEQSPEIRELGVGDILRRVPKLYR